MESSDLHYLGAVEALRLMKEKRLSPVELMDAVIARAEAVNPRINAFSQCFFERAREQARAAEARYAAGRRTRALEGLPLAVKDEEPIEGLPASQGCMGLKNEIAAYSSYIVERCFRAGALMHLRTTTPRVLLRRCHPHPALGRDPQPLEPAVHAGGLFRRHRGDARLRGRDARHRLRHRRLDPHPCRLLGGGGLQAPLRAQPPEPHFQPRFLLPFRPHGAFGRRLRPAAERDGGAASARHRHAEAEAAPAARLRLRRRHEDRVLHGSGLLRGRRGRAEETPATRSTSCATRARRSRRSRSAGHRRC